MTKLVVSNWYDWRWKIMINLTKNEEKVLKFIAVNGETSAYQASKALKIRYSNAHVAFKSLERKNLIMQSRTLINIKGAPIKTYTLTRAGALAAIMMGWRGEGAEKHAELEPLVFGKWTHLKRFIPDAELSAALQEAISDFIPELQQRLAELIQGFKILFVSSFLHLSFYSVPFNPLGKYKFSCEKWVEAMRSDPELKNWAKEFFTLKKNQFMVRASIFDAVLRGLEGQKVSFDEFFE
ncbi:MAG: MarR family winged helix-turn-helix transcriptional regulator [Nitrososphaerota archaeon]